MQGDAPRPLGRLGQAVVGIFGLLVVVKLATLVVDFEQLRLVTDIREGERVSLQEISESDDRVLTFGLLQGGVYLACVVAFLIWYGRAYRNTERLGARGHRYGKRWAIAYWFIPIVNLFRPKQVMNDIWRASDPDLPATAHHWRDRPVPALMHWWWAFWLVSNIVSSALTRAAFDAPDSANESVASAREFVALDVVDLVPAILAILVIRRVTARQEERRDCYERGALAEPHAPEGPRPPEDPRPPADPTPVSA